MASTLRPAELFALDALVTPTTKGIASRVLVRVRGGPGYRFHGLPLLLTRLVVRLVHFVMQRKQLLGIASRAENTRLRTRSTL